MEEPILVLNEVTIDRGISSYLTFLECYCDSSFVTCVQGDGLIISTTSGSTAYSLAAGGSMVHPQVIINIHFAPPVFEIHTKRITASLVRVFILNNKDLLHSKKVITYFIMHLSYFVQCIADQMNYSSFNKSVKHQPP